MERKLQNKQIVVVWQSLYERGWSLWNERR